MGGRAISGSGVLTTREATDARFSFGEVASGASASYAAQCGSADALSAVTHFHWQTAPCGCARVDASVVAVAGATLCARRLSKRAVAGAVARSCATLCGDIAAAEGADGECAMAWAVPGPNLVGGTSCACIPLHLSG